MMDNELRFEKQVNVTKPKLPPFQSYVEKIESVWENNWLTNNGPLHEEFKQNLKAHLNSENIELFVNGHLALETALKTLGGEERSSLLLLHLHQLFMLSQMPV